jgi:iron(III) transport system substrate-binding protein
MNRPVHRVNGRRQPPLLAAVPLSLSVYLGFAGGAFAQDADLSPAEQIYADLAKLPATERTARIEEGARKERRVVIIQALRDQLGSGQIELFQKRYPYVKTEWTNSLGSPEGAERLYSEEAAGRHLTDVINVTIVDLAELRKRNMLARYKTPAIERVLPKFRDMADPEGRYTLSNWSERGMVYNTNLVPPDKAPKQWMDLCDPFFKSSISFDPVQARLVAGFHAMFGEKTMDFFRCLGANKPIVQRGPPQRFNLMIAGDHMVVADAYPYQAVAEKRKNPHADVAIAAAPFLANFGAMGINRDTQHPYTTALFVDWMLSDEAQTYLFDHLRGPVTLKHPYLSDDADIVVMPDLPKEQLDPLVDEWRRDVEGRP